MKKCLQYFWPFLWPNVSAMVVFEAVVVVLALVSGVPQGQDGIFAPTSTPCPCSFCCSSLCTACL